MRHRIWGNLLIAVAGPASAAVPPGVPVASWGAYGSGDGELSLPNGIAVDAAGNTYVADTANHRIEVFDPSGAYASQWGTLGSANLLTLSTQVFPTIPRTVSK